MLTHEINGLALVRDQTLSSVSAALRLERDDVEIPFSGSQVVLDFASLSASLVSNYVPMVGAFSELLLWTYRSATGSSPQGNDYYIPNAMRFFCGKGKSGTSLARILITYSR